MPQSPKRQPLDAPRTSLPSKARGGSERLHVVIPFYDGHDDLARLLHSIDTSSQPPRHIWIVDNSPNERRLSALPVTLTTPVSIAHAQSGIGFGRACNLGAALATRKGATHICLLNQDGYVDPEMFTSLLADLSLMPAELIAPLVLEPETRQLSRFVARLYVPEALRGRTVAPRETLPKCARLESQYLCGAALLFRSTLLEQHGLFDPLFTMYGEDRDLCERLRRADGRLALSRSAIFYHAHTNATARGAARAKLLSWQSESRAVVRMRTSTPSWTMDLVESSVLWGRACLVAGPRAANAAVRQRSAGLRAKASALTACRRGESLITRTLACVEVDLGISA